MQKFTRALTREIEVGSERLAVTLDEKGLSIRPVGSRRPPHTLSWSAVLCSAGQGEPSPDVVAQALEALRSGKVAKSSIKPLVTMPPPVGLPDILSRLDDWLMKHRKRYHEGLLAGATDQQLAELSDVWGKPIPEELATWLRWHNGQHEDLIGAFVEAFNLMSAAEIAATLMERNSEKDWNSAFIPILDDYQGDLVVLDSSKVGLPVCEVWRGRDDHPVVAASMENWLAGLLADFEAGRYHEDPERGEFMRCSD